MFSNLCYFLRARCLAEQNGDSLLIAHDGQCLPTNCTELSACDESVVEPVCGGDLKTYPNPCSFVSMQCQHRDATGEVIEVGPIVVCPRNATVSSRCSKATVASACDPTVIWPLPSRPSTS